MRILIDFTALMPRSTGVDNYMKQLLLSLAKVDADNQYLICLNVEDRHLFGDSLPGNFTCKAVSVRPRLLRLFYQQCLLPLIAWAWKADIVHSPAFIMPFIRGASRHVLTIHDMTSFSHPDCHNRLRRSSLYLAMVKASIKRADIILTPSMATRQAIIEWMPEVDAKRIQCTPLGVDEHFRLIDAGRVKDTTTRLELPPRYILYVGTLEPRKNLPALVECFRQLVEADAVQEHLVIVGQLGWGYDELLKQIETPVLNGRVHLAGYVDQQDLPSVYAGARLFVYPSLFEGFGFPPLEAMACGVPAVSTQTSSLAENLAGSAELVPPGNIEALGAAIKRLLTDDELWNRRRGQGLELVKKYRWEKTADVTLAAYRTASGTEFGGMGS